MNKKNLVVLVHGIAKGARRMEPLARFLRREGWTVFPATLTPCWGQIGLDKLAEQLAAFADEKIPTNEKFDLIGFSMGGIVSRFYVQRLGGIERVERFITISSPHHGTVLAHLLGNEGCRQMRRGSEFLRDLNRDKEMLARVRFTSIWTPFDLIIVPQNSSQLGVGREIKTGALAHPLQVLQPYYQRLIAHVLREN